MRIFIAAFLLLSVMPLEAFCQDNHCMEASSACAVNCHHAVSHNVVIPAQQPVTLSSQSSESFIAYQLSYENPILLSLKKPPIVLS